MNPLIRADNLHYTYNLDTEAPITALAGVSLKVWPGEYLAIVGRNGSGKSTLARCLNSLALPTAGEVRVNGLDTRNPRAWREIRSTVGMVFQNPDNQFVSTVVEDEVAFGPANLGLPRDGLRQRGDWALAATGLADARNANPRILSAGDKARLAIAAILAMRPQCLALDESTAYLDPVARRDILALLARLHAEGLTVIVITHFMDEAARAERMIVLDRGRVALEGAPRQVFAQAEPLEALGLSLPPAAAIARGLQQRGAQRGTRIYAKGAASLPLDARELAAALISLPGFMGGSLKGSESMPAAEAGRLQLPSPPSRAKNITSCSPLAAGGRLGNHSLPASAAGGSGEPFKLTPIPPIVALRGVEYTYLADTPLAARALDGADLTLYRGEIAALIGPNGAGKSTLAQFIAGLLRPASPGRAMVFGQDTALPSCDLATLRRQVGLVWQSPAEQLIERFVGDDVAYGPRQLGLTRDEVRERVRWALEAVGLTFEGFVDRRTYGLSGGEMRRVALAGVLALRPELLILDEATTGLDPQGRREIHDLLRRLRDQEGLTVLLISNDMDEVAALAERVTVLRQGKTLAAGPMREVFARAEELEALGLAAPSAGAIARALRQEGIEIAADALTPGELEEALWRTMTR